MFQLRLATRPFVCGGVDINQEVQRRRRLSRHHNTVQSPCADAHSGASILRRFPALLVLCLAVLCAPAMSSAGPAWLPTGAPPCRHGTACSCASDQRPAECSHPPGTGACPLAPGRVRMGVRVCSNARGSKMRGVSLSAPAFLSRAEAGRALCSWGG